MIGMRPHHPSGLRGYCFRCGNCERFFESYLNREGHPGSPYTNLISPHCGIFFVPEGGGSRDSCLGGGEFELLIETVNPVPAGTLVF
jgi:hypothetical protein